MYAFNFDAARKNLFPNGYTQAQVDCINLLIKEFYDQGLSQKEQLAYVLATAYHECYNPKVPANRITPMQEFGGLAYLKSKPYYPYYGRGFVQLTWKTNYQKESKRLGIDLVNNPNWVLNKDIAANIAIHGMKNGTFTGKKLADYINSQKVDYSNARRIINGIDKKDLIADYAIKFNLYLSKSIDFNGMILL